jgi:hypothetical protein
MDKGAGANCKNYFIPAALEIVSVIVHQDADGNLRNRMRGYYFVLLRHSIHCELIFIYRLNVSRQSVRI